MYTHTYLVHSFSILLDQLCLQGVSCRSHPEDPGSSEHKAANFSILRIPGRVPSRQGIAQIAGKWEPHNSTLLFIYWIPLKEKVLWMLNRRWTHAPCFLWRSVKTHCCLIVFPFLMSFCIIGSSLQTKSLQQPSAPEQSQVAVASLFGGIIKKSWSFTLLDFLSWELQAHVSKLYILKDRSDLFNFLISRREGTSYCYVIGF